MLQKVKAFLTKNVGLKILSVLISIALWLIVVNIDNPTIMRSFRIPVEVLNTNVIEEMGKVYDIQSQSDHVTIYVTGRRSYLDGVTGDNFLATADFNQANLTSGDLIHVPIQVKATRFEGQLTIIRQDNNLLITLEDVVSKPFNVTVEPQGSLADGFAIGQTVVTPNIVQVSGPQSAVSSIDRVVVEPDVQGLHADITVNKVPRLFDAGGQEIKAGQLHVSQEMVAVRIEVLGTKTVSVRCEVSGTPAEGYHSVGIEFAPRTITVKGFANALEPFDELVIPGSAIDVSGATGSLELTIDLKEFLPDGVYLTEGQSEELAVKVLMERLEPDVQTISLPVAQVEVQNLEAGLELSYGQATIPIEVRALPGNMNQGNLGQLGPGILQAAIDLAGLTVGAHEVEVRVAIEDAGYEVVGRAMALIQISEEVREGIENE